MKHALVNRKSPTVSTQHPTPVASPSRRVSKSVRLLITLCIIGVFSCAIFPQAPTLQAQTNPESYPGPLIDLYADPAGQLSRVGQPTAQLQSPSIATATFIITYTGFSPQAQAAFQAAVNIWSTKISSSVPIRINATWKNLGSGILGSAGATFLFRDFSGAPRSNTYYPVALANKLAGFDIDPANGDITANFNSTFPSWYYGTDGNTPLGSYDLMTVVMHEIGHGLGFSGSATVSSGSGRWGNSGIPSVYDHFIVNGSSQAIINTALFANPSVALGNQLTSDNLFFNGPYAIAAAGERPKLYIPTPWEQGSSYSHLDETYYPAGDPNSLMTPALGPGESILDPGPITLGIFRDIGWSPPLILNYHTHLPLVQN
jgi:hypothetical protein